ncbi:hypothetical protein GIB67_034066 [Kingdonia uniflora]|uniref:Uncharacterized protein n=1 Tax=Kingdonia uniflora TaxID=39325 RepID=A0A7J7M670_9MAGN|nr:hypothetical protein GIB67_034066 [Kingdonia uniflora]
MEKTRVFRFLAGLNPDFKYTRVNIFDRTPFPTLEEAHAYFLSNQSRRSPMPPISGIPSEASVMAVHYAYSAPPSLPSKTSHTSSPSLSPLLTASASHAGNFASTNSISASSTSPWIVDLGTTDNMIGMSSLFRSYASSLWRRTVYTRRHPGRQPPISDGQASSVAPGPSPVTNSPLSGIEPSHTLPLSGIEPSHTSHLLGIEPSHISFIPFVIADRGLQLLSTTFIFSIFETFVLYVSGRQSHDKGSSLKPHVSGNIIHDSWFGIQLNPQFLGIDLKFFFVRAGMMGWLLINLSVLAKSIQDGSTSLSMILYQLFCLLYILDYFCYEEYMTSTWDIIAERLGFMLVFGDLVWIPFTFSMQACNNQLKLDRFRGWWLLNNKVELPKAAVIANCLVFQMGYLVFRGANKQKHVFKKNPKAPIWGVSPKVIGGKLLASGYW